MIKFKLIYGNEGFLVAKEFMEETFNREVGCKYINDEYDDKACHIVGREDDIVICYARLYKIGEYSSKIDRVCVRKSDRKMYVADTMLRALEDKAVSMISSQIFVDAPKNTFEFFIHEGYVDENLDYIKDEVLFKKLKKDLTKVRGCRGGCQK